jgi:tRNA-specific 2-thiouridylase
MYNWAMENGFDFVATGHYAQIAQSGEQYHLMRSEDDFKDQTYFIHYIKTEQLPHILFPVGGMKKDAVRALAREINLPNAEKKESMGLCFVGKIRLKEFLSQKVKLVPGPIIDQSGKIIGQHEGLPNYTIGQRQGIKVGATGPYYVVRKDLDTNTLYVTNDPHDLALSSKQITISDVNWIEKPEHFPCQVQARYRHQGELVPALIDRVSDNRYRVTFGESQEALASGQSLVMYQDRVCLGGGVIE